jgi:hypothetical protein
VLCPNKVVGITQVPAANSGRTLFRAAVSLHFGWFETWTTVPITDLGIGGGTSGVAWIVASSVFSQKYWRLAPRLTVFFCSFGPFWTPDFEVNFRAFLFGRKDDSVRWITLAASADDFNSTMELD